MINPILTVIGMSSLMNLIHKTPLYHRVLDRLNLDKKPFNCVMCSTFWVTLGFTVFSNPMESIFISAVTAVLAELINIEIHKI